MLIEQFDTGLKSKKDIKDINLSPKENHTNKLFVRNEPVSYTHLRAHET